MLGASVFWSKNIRDPFYPPYYYQRQRLQIDQQLLSSELLRAFNLWNKVCWINIRFSAMILLVFFLFSVLFCILIPFHFLLLLFVLWFHYTPSIPITLFAFRFSSQWVCVCLCMCFLFCCIAICLYRYLSLLNERKKINRFVL